MGNVQLFGTGENVSQQIVACPVVFDDDFLEFFREVFCREHDTACGRALRTDKLVQLIRRICRAGCVLRRVRLGSRSGACRGLSMLAVVSAPP